MMEFKDLEKSTKLFDKIKKLDAEIIEIERFALRIANGEGAPQFEFKIEKAKDQKAVVDCEEDLEGIAHRMLSYSFLRFGSCEETQKKQKTETESLKNTLSDRAALEILSILLRERQSQRTSLIKKLQKFGIVA